MASGTILIDFGGAYVNNASVAVTGQAGILGGSFVEAWLSPATTTDHSVDEHVITSSMLGITTGPPSAGVGFTIYGASYVSGGLYGKFNVSWVWV